MNHHASTCRPSAPGAWTAVALTIPLRCFTAGLMRDPALILTTCCVACADRASRNGRGGALTAAQYADQTLTLLEEATGISGKVSMTDAAAFPSGLPILPGAAVKFPPGQVVAADRVGMWVDGGDLCMSIWPCELQPQYERVYSDRDLVEALVALGEEAGWQLNSNFHLAHRFAAPQQRWYPGRHLPGPTYVRQWIDDYREGRAKGRDREQLQDSSFRQWLVDRSYATEAELPTLDQWLDSKPPGVKFHVRPSVQVLRTWSVHDVLAHDRVAEFVAELRNAIDKALTTLREPTLKDLRVEKSTPSAPLTRAKSVAPKAAASKETACPACQTIHAGECL